MGGESRARIVGSWPAIARVRAALCGAAWPGLLVLAAPAGVPRAALADASARGERVLAYVTDLTAVHAAALFIAGVDGFATRLAELPHAATGVIDRRLHLEPMSALAVLHLARSVGDPAFDPLAAAARACAAGQPWPPFHDADDLAAAAQHLRRRLYVHRRSNGGFSHFCHRRSSRHTSDGWSSWESPRTFHN